MPGWTDKDDRQYEAIRDSNLERGMKKERAKEVAARTVNKQRREKGETPNKRTQGTGNPHSSLESRTKDELYNIAQKMSIRGRSKMSKPQLIDAIRDRR
ncbi:Rho termination factor N-terminal domain-containing protein [Bremerella sp. JC817]|uniref:Rho termination factor N-terminal domain-containing protein n=1 Tax=Bremerella sp. JC817 TaxID=3231756 RepID=UPI003459CA45